MVMFRRNSLAYPTKWRLCFDCTIPPPFTEGGEGIVTACPSVHPTFATPQTRFRAPAPLAQGSPWQPLPRSTLFLGLLSFVIILRPGQSAWFRRLRRPLSLYTSKLANWALASMKAFRGSTLSPISTLKVSSAFMASSMVICTITRLLGSIVVSHSCSGFISPRPL